MTLHQRRRAENDARALGQPDHHSTAPAASTPPGPAALDAADAGDPTPAKRIQAYCQWDARVREPGTRIVLQHDVVSAPHLPTRPDIRLRVCEEHAAESRRFAPGYELIEDAAVETEMAA